MLLLKRKKHAELYAETTGITRRYLIFYRGELVAATHLRSFAEAEFRSKV